VKYCASASPAEVTPVDQTLEQIKVPINARVRRKKRRKRLIADKGYDSDSDPLRKKLKESSIELICSQRKKRKEVIDLSHRVIICYKLY
jgi:hypothetical protein